MKIQLFAQFPVDLLSNPVVPTIVFLRVQCADFTYVVDFFHSNSFQITYTYYYSEIIIIIISLLALLGNISLNSEWQQVTSGGAGGLSLSEKDTETRSCLQFT